MYGDCSYVTANSVRLHYSAAGLLVRIHRSVQWASYKTQILCASKTYELSTVRWVVRIVTTVRQTVSQKLYTRTDDSQLRTLSVARFPRTPVTANTNSTPKADTLNYMQFVRARNTVTTQSAGLARSNYSQQAALLQKQTRRNRRTPMRYVLCRARGKSEANTKFQSGGRGRRKTTVSTKTGR